MAIQYFIVSIIVIAVIFWQWASYKKNEKRIEKIRTLFPTEGDSFVVKTNDSTSIYNAEATGEFKETLDDINSYLAKNKNKTFDYHILKEIVDRNSKSLEDEVDTMLSIPLYLGLIATIFGIAFGIIMFAWKDLAGLLSGANMNPEGIKILLTDVGIAMAASLCGVYFTKQSTAHFTEARSLMAKNKNRFLTWIQTDLMSKLSDDITGAILKMTQDLNEFNSSFAENTRELKETLSTVNSNYEGQVKLLAAIDKLKITKIAKANIEVYDRLQGCTEELENLFNILADSETYIAKVVELNTQLGNIEHRTQLFEELGNYFKNEIEYVKDRQGMMRQQMSSLDSVLQDALSNMGESLNNSLGDLTRVFQTQNQRIQELIEEQQQALSDSLRDQQRSINEKIGQIENPFGNIKDIFAEGTNSIKETFEEQSLTIKEMLSSQNQTFEKALKEQQEIVLQKLHSAPNQMQAVSDMIKMIEKLNQTLLRIEQKPQSVPALSFIPSGMSDTTSKCEKDWETKLKRYFVPVCALGSFLALLGILILQILES